MTPDDAFFQAILESPDDDAPRLIYADWLEERGDPRGEFIRVQCELAKMAEDDPRRPRLEAQESELLAAFENSWLGPLSGCFVSCDFRRGFVEMVATRTGPFLEHAEFLFRSTPVNSCCFLDMARFSAVMSCPFLRRVVSLDFSVVHFVSRVLFDDQALRTLLDCPYLDRLSLLNLSNTDVSDAGLYLALLNYPRLARLKFLYLMKTSLGDEVRSALRSIFGERVQF